MYIGKFLPNVLTLSKNAQMSVQKFEQTHLFGFFLIKWQKVSWFGAGGYSKDFHKCSFFFYEHVLVFFPNM